MTGVTDVVDAHGNSARRKPVTGDYHWDGHHWCRWSGKRWARAAYSLQPERLSDPSPLHLDTCIDDEARQRALSLAVEDQVMMSGATAVLDGASGTVLAYRRTVAHAFHGVLTVVTGGMWGVVWLSLALGRGDDRIQLEADAWGNVWARPVRGT